MEPLHISNRALETPASGIRKMMNRAFELEDVISLAAGEPDFTAHPKVVEAANRANLEGRTKYTPSAGILPLREKIAENMKRDLHAEYDPKSEILITIGGQEALLLSMLALTDPGDNIIVTDPCWCNYLGHLRICDALPNIVPVYEKDAFCYDPENIRKAINKRTRAIILTSPNNPCGSVTPLETLKEIAKIAIENDLFVISDEAYRYFTFDGEKHISISSLPGMKEHTIVCDTFSKGWAMTGWRVGWAAGPKEIIAQMTKMHEDTTCNVNTSAQWGACAALDLPYEVIEEMRVSYERRCKLLVDGLNKMKNVSCLYPKGAIYAFANISKTGLSSSEFAERLMEETGVVVAPGSTFGATGEGFVRLCYAIAEDRLVEAIRRMDKFTREL